MSTILTIEDTQDNFDLIEEALSEIHEVLHARTGQEGLAQAKACLPDLILLDIGLPTMTGYEVVRRLKADPSLKNIPVVALTAYAMNGDREKCLQAGCDHYMSKPINVRELVKSVEQYLNAQRPLVFPGIPQ